MAYAVRSTRVGAPGFLRELEQAVWSAVSGGLALLALLATYFPARHAARVDPVVALRAEA